MLERINHSKCPFVLIQKFYFSSMVLEKVSGTMKWVFSPMSINFQSKTDGTINQVGTSDIYHWQMTDVFDTS